MLHLLKGIHLPLNGSSLLLRHRLGVKLVPRRTEMRDIGTRIKGRNSSRLMVGADGGVAGLCRKGIDDGRAVLDARAHIGIGVVARPNLGEIVEKCGVKASAAARAPLKENVGIALDDALAQVVKTERVAVVHLPLSLGRELRRIVFGEQTVEIPLHAHPLS